MATFQHPAQTIYEPLPCQLPIISPQYVVDYVVNLKVTKNSMTIGTYNVTDFKDVDMFKIEDSFFSIHDRRVLTDGVGHAIINFQHKLCSLHKRWPAYRGRSRDSEDMLFTIRTSSIVQWSIELDVFLGSNPVEGECDFKIKETEDGIYTIFLRDSSIAVAELTQMMTSKFFGEDKFRVAVNPNMDYAFIVSLGVILYELIRSQKRKLMGTPLNLVTGLSID